MIYDVHVHIMPGAYDAHKRQILKTAELYNVDKFFVSALNAIPNPTEEQVEEANTAAFNFRDEHPGLIESYVYVSPEHPNALNMLRTAMEDRGAVGLKIWMSTTCDDPRVNKIVEQMIEYDAPILIHAFHKAVGQLPFETTGEHVARLAERYPESKLIMAHLGGNAYHGIPPIRDYKNVWVDMCSSIFRGDELTYALEMVGEDRLLYGTDIPGPCLVNIGQVEELDASREVKDKIFYKNTQKLFGGLLK